jgi:hypothetical protein
MHDHHLVIDRCYPLISSNSIISLKVTGSKYPLVVKLGTITPHGADVYSYASDEDDMVIDPYLAQHLVHWGINMMQVKASILCGSFSLKRCHVDTPTREDELFSRPLLFLT